MHCESTSFSLADIFLLLGVKVRTGELILEAGNNIGAVVFYQGRILQAYSPYSRAIGDLLVDEGIITDEELLEILQLQRKSGVAPIGRLFLRAGKVTIEVIEMMVHEQIRQSIIEFMRWERLRVSFVEKDIKPVDEISLSVHEFIPDRIRQSGQRFFSGCATQKKDASSTLRISTTI